VFRCPSWCKGHWVNARIDDPQITNLLRVISAQAKDSLLDKTPTTAYYGDVLREMQGLLEKKPREFFVKLEQLFASDRQPY